MSFLSETYVFTPRLFFFQSVSESQSFQTTVGEWQKPFWELDAAGQSDLCETVHKPGGSKGVAHVVFLLISLLHFPLLPTSLLGPSERESSVAHTDGTALSPPVCSPLLWLRPHIWWLTVWFPSQKSHGETVENAGNSVIRQLQPSRRLGEDGLLPDARLGQSQPAHFCKHKPPLAKHFR